LAPHPISVSCRPFLRIRGQAVVASDTPMYLDQFVTMDGVTAPVAHFPMAGWHQGMYVQQPFTAQAYLGTSMSVYGVNPHLTQAPITGAFPVEPHNSPATTSAQAARYDPASEYTEISGEPELYSCQWEGCTAGRMPYSEILEHFRAHGEIIRETGRIKECKWKDCNPKPGAFPMKPDGFRRHVNETQSHAEIGSLTKLKCKKCGMKKSKRSMSYHRRICSRKSKGPEDNGKKRQD